MPTSQTLSIAGAVLTLLATASAGCTRKGPFQGFREEWRGPYDVIYAAEGATCAARGEKVTCWGGKYDVDRAKNFEAPRPFGGFKLLRVRAGICGVGRDDALVCDRTFPSRSGRILDLDAHAGTLCTVDASHDLLCDDRSPSPLVIRRAGVAKVVLDGIQSICTLDVDGSVGCYKLVDDTRMRIPKPERLPVLHGKYTDVSVMGGHGCALREDRSAECWGGSLPVNVEHKFKSLHVASGGYAGPFACGILEDGTLRCVGAGVGGFPQAPPEGKFVSVTVHRIHACAMRDNGRVICWGGNAQGQVTGRWWS